MVGCEVVVRHVKRRIITTIILAVFILAITLPGLMPTINAAVPGNDIKAHTTFIALPLYEVSDPLTPSQIISAYNLNSTTGGAGTTIAIIDAYNDPTIQADLANFSSYFDLPPANLVMHKMTSNITVNGDWALETSLDVEWAHAIAPNATILLVEATTNNFNDLFAAISYATQYPGVVAVSMSWGASEFSGETSYDSYFTAPGITFFASSGDNGAGVIYPSSSPYVVGVGGTTLNIANGQVTSETAWNGSGGGVSAYEPVPTYQTSYGLNYTGRAVPDVSYDANPYTGFVVYDSTPYDGESGWWGVGGTSAGAPQWAAIQALGLSANNNNFYLDAKSANYSSYFRDITVGSNGYPATVGYDLVTGLGSPLTTNYAAIVLSSTTTTQLNATSITLGQTVGDNATVTGSGPVPTGYVLFKNNATGSWVTFANVTLVNGTIASTPFTPGNAGTFYFQAIYSGDGNYMGSQSEPTTEILIVSKATSSVTTLLNASTIDLGQSVIDTVNVSFVISIPPSPVPTGTVAFKVKLPNGTWTSLGTVSTVWNNNTQLYYAVSTGFTPTQTGTYYFNATYSGDGNYTGSTLSALESLTVGWASKVVTNLNSTQITLGQVIYDDATVTGSGPVPTGYVLFKNNATGSWVTFANATLKNGVVPFVNYTPLYAGTFFSQAIYSGNSYYIGSTSTLENVTIIKSPSTTEANLNSTSIALGGTVQGTANVSFVISIPPFPVPSGTMTFKVKLPNGTWTSLGTASTVWDNNTKQFYTVSAGFTPTQIGTYFFNATYSGDSNYIGSTSPASVLETLTVTQATPTVVTCVNGTGVTAANLGGIIRDEVTVTGVDGIVPTGTVEFYVTCPNGTEVDLGPQTLDANGVAWSNYITLYSAGSYYFQVLYYGDGNYTWQTSTWEPFTVT